MFADATPKSGFPGLVAGVRRFFADFRAAFVAAQNAKRVFRDLSRLTDEQLAARGLTRADVARLTQQALWDEAGT